jgi:hypothetical protein
MAFTRAEVDSIVVGKTKLQWGLGYGRFGEPKEVTRIFAKRDDIHGKLFVCGYHKHSEDTGSEMSFSIKEGSEADARLYRIINDGDE